MKALWLAVALASSALAQTSPMDGFRWWLDPRGQDVLINVDDIHDEHVTAVPAMDWGRAVVPQLQLKKDVLIAVIDGGMDLEHPELAAHVAYNAQECAENNVIPPNGGDDKDGNGYKGDCAGWNFVTNDNRVEDQDGHGTHVTGIIRSVMDRAHGDFKFVPLTVFAAGEGTGTSVSTPLPTRLAKAFEYALSRNVDVIHLSVGWPKSFMTPDLKAAIQKAIDRGVAVVAAAGNSSQVATVFPCQMEGVICVGALRPNGEVARFSNWGTQVDVFAPGEKILSTIPLTIPPKFISRKGYDYKNGTSQAAPFISGAMGLLKGLYPDERINVLQARLLSTADAPVANRGLKGLFHLDRAVDARPADYVFPMLKGLSGVELTAGRSFSIKVPVRNYGAAASKATQARLSCGPATLTKASAPVAALASGASTEVSFAGSVGAIDQLLCTLSVGQQAVPLRLKVKAAFPEPQKSIEVQQTNDILVIKTPMGVRSRFLTLNALKGTTPAPLYYVPGKAGIRIYREEQDLGVLPLKSNCQFLRIWQINVDHRDQNELLMETMCDKTQLEYQFLTLDLKLMYPALAYKPELTVLNYDEFDLLPGTESTPPTFRFIGTGFVPAPDSPWRTPDLSQGTHAYEMRPTKDGANWKYVAVMTEKPDAWAKSLALRYTPSYDVYHQIGNRLLVKFGQKTAWVDMATQTAAWANLDELLLLGSQKQPLWNGTGVVLQSFLTPYDYRGFVVDTGVKLRFLQPDQFDPLLDVVGTQKNALGYLCILRTYQSLVYLQFDAGGNQLSRKDVVVDRFDFLSADDLMATVVTVPVNGELIQVVDGSKVNTNYVDVIRGGQTRSFVIPDGCVTQQPLEIDGRPVLPLFCAKDKTSFEMRFYGL